MPRAGGRIVIAWSYHPRPLPLSGPISTLQMAAKRGMDVTILRPDGFALPAPVMHRARDLARSSGGRVRESSDKREALRDAEVIYAREWSCTDFYGQTAVDSQLRHALTHWRVTDDWFEHAARDCRLMHAMPVRRGVAVDDAVLDGPRSALTLQAGNRMWAQIAIAYRMML